MTRIFTLCVTVLCVLLTPAQSFATTYTYNSNSSVNSYNLNNGDSLSIAGGTFTGQINSNATGAKITVAQNASFNPTVFNFLGSLKVMGSAKLPVINGYVSGLKVTNSGNITVTGMSYVTGGTITNEYGAVITFTTSAQFQNNNATLINKGTVVAKADMYFGRSTVTNTGNITAEGEIKFDDNTSATNSGKMYSKSVMTLQNSTYINTCRTIAEKGVKILTNTVFTNNGLLWASYAKSDSYIENQGTIIAQPNSRIKAVNLMNFGTIRGSGFLYFTGTTSTQGVVGTTTPSTDMLVVYDVTRTNATQIFDYQAGTVRSTVQYASFAAPDTINNYLNCSPEQSLIALTVKWDYFFVNLADNTPSLSWGAEQDPGTVYEIQRSYDGINFSAVNTIASDVSKTEYTYSDKQVNTQSSVVYYRIKGIEPTGKEVFSATKTIRFSIKTGVTIQAVPNPFTSHVTISYQTTERGMISITVYSLNGQLQFTKNAAVSNGYNSIAVTEAIALPKGMYMVQVSRNNQLVSSEKIVKQ